MNNPKLDPRAAPFVPKHPSVAAMLAYMNDEFVFTSTGIFKDVLGHNHGYTTAQLAEIDKFIARGVKEGYFHAVKDGIFRASWRELERRAELLKAERGKRTADKPELLLEN